MEGSRMEVDKTALLVMDCQNDTIHEKGALAAWGFAAQVKERRIVERIQEVIAGARKAKIPVIYVAVVLRHDRVDVIGNCAFFHAVREMPVLEEGSWGAAIHEELEPDPKDVVVDKKRISAFAGTSLDHVLRAQGRTTLILTGVATNFVVEGTARDACDAGYKVVVLEDCCAAGSAEMHRFSVENILALLTTVTNSAEWLKEISKAGLGLN